MADNVEQQVAELLEAGETSEAILAVARAVDRALVPQAEAERLQRLAEEGYEQGRQGG